ncbi:hypothetical protein HDU76_003026 [Blyttiomyces sp. JEL0837]|nr:hypothetical protein HDU76_003026 [Blyttiomyces sp. JEL0837]
MWSLAVFLLQTIALSSPSSWSWLSKTSSPPVELPRGVKVTSLYIYPIKSCAALKISSGWVNRYGFEFDRMWIVVKSSDGKTITQREFPRMVLIKCRIEAKQDGPNAYNKGGRLVVSAPDVPDLIVPFRSFIDLFLFHSRFYSTMSFDPIHIAKSSFDDIKPEKIDMYWINNLDGIDEGPDAAIWFSKFTGMDVKLLVKDARSIRPLDAKHTPPDSMLTHKAETAFADCFPFLVATEASVSHVNKTFQNMSPPLKPISIINFRPNIVVAADPNLPNSHLSPYAEETWKTVTLGDIRKHIFYISGRCMRCQMPGNCPEKAELDMNVSNSLMKFRRSDPGVKSVACFGMNAVAKECDFKVSIGDALEVLEFAVHDGKVGVWQPGA